MYALFKQRRIDSAAAAVDREDVLRFQAKRSGLKHHALSRPLPLFSLNGGAYETRTRDPHTASVVRCRPRWSKIHL